MFLGRFAHVVDVKGRLAVPARFRDDLAGGVVLTRGIDPCLALYPLDRWFALAENINALPVGDPDARIFRRMVFADAIDLELDGQGRILLPAESRRFAAIERDVYVVGVHSFVEIWNPERWAETAAKMEDEGPAVAMRLASLI